MAKYYTSTIQVRCWKEHTCAGCGSVYAYILARKVMGRASSPAKAQVAMNKEVDRTIQRATDFHPCPNCGLYQPDMIGQKRTKSRLQIFWIGLICLGVLLILRATNVFQANTSTWIAALLCGFVVAAQLLLEVLNYNGNLAANQALAAERVASGVLKTAPGAGGARNSEQLARPGRSPMHLLALLLLLVSLAMVVSPEVLRSVHGWPLNAKCYPPVVGTSDTTRVYMTGSITSVSGFWRGDPKVMLHYDGAPADAQPLAAVTNQNSWGSTIDTDSNSKTSSSHPWVDITMPDIPDLVGKTVDCDIELGVEYPQLNPDGSSFSVVDTDMSDTVPIQIAPRAAGAQYDAIWWGGTAGGTGVVLLASLILWSQARGMYRKANPTKVFAAA